VVTVGSPEGQPHALRLAVPLARHHATMRMYWRAAGAIGALVTLLLLGLQIRHARTLDRRIVGLAAHMRRLRQGDFDGLPPVDTGDDVLTELREAIADATARLQAARTAQERLLADAAHELRTPLAAMRTDIDIALRRERDPAELRETLKRSRQEVDRLALLSKQLLDLAALRQTEWDRAAGDVVQVIEEALQAHRAVAEERGVRLVRAGLPMLQARFQSAPLRQVVDNLLSNALRFAPRGSTVTVAVDRAGDKWRLTVQDEGAGVPEGEQQAIFQPFHRPDKSSSGAGLGLAIVQDVARRHGGRAYVDTGGPGTRFVVEMNLDS
jgi:signal transduction histidine kinase